MVYRRTEAVEARGEAKKAAIVRATVMLMSRRGMDGVTTDDVAEAVGGSIGMLYTYFPDKDEMIAAAVSQVLGKDVAAMRKAEGEHRAAIDALTAALMTFYGRMKRPRLVRALFEIPFYRESIRDEIAALIKPARDMPDGERIMAANAVLGVLYGVYQARGEAEIAAQFALRCIGLSEGVIERAIDRHMERA